MAKDIPVHIGLVGHIDHGKTELARAMSEKVSTAGLDKHPQSEERGITIDLGFTMFKLHEYLVTLVDAPGHADLIRSVVAGASIIDAAIVCVAADEGPKIQTGEHIIILGAFDIDPVIVAVTKSDLVGELELERMAGRIRSILDGSGIKNYDIVNVSAKTGKGIDDLKSLIYRIVKPHIRDTQNPFLMPIDHAFPKKGHGTVVTGTILRGSISTGGTVQLVPHSDRVRVRSIQVFGEQQEKAQAGNRVGVNIPDVKSESIHRGDYLCAPSSLPASDKVYATISLNPLYRGKVTKRMVLSATIGMPTVTAEIVPFITRSDGIRVVLDEAQDSLFLAAVLLQKKIGVEPGMRVLLMRTDLRPTAMRIVGTGTVTEVPDRIILFKQRVRKGTVFRIRENDVLVEGLASTKEIAERLQGHSLSTASGHSGKVTGTFGTRGVISATFTRSVDVNDKVFYETLREEEFSFGH